MTDGLDGVIAYRVISRLASELGTDREQLYAALRTLLATTAAAGKHACRCRADEGLGAASAAPTAVNRDRLLKPAEAAALLGYTDRYVLRLGRKGTLPRVKPDGSKYVRFRLSDVLAYRDSRRESPARQARAGVLAPDARGSGSCVKSASPRRRF